MFASKVAKPQSKTAESQTSSLSPHGSTLAGHLLGHDPVEPALFLQRTVGNQAMLRLLAQRASWPEQELAPEDRAAPVAPRGLSWDFSKIPIFPPDRTSRSQTALHRAVAPLPGVIQAKLEIGAVDDPLEAEADCVADQVMRMANPAQPARESAPVVRRMCPECKDQDEEKEQNIQRKPSCVGDCGDRAPQSVHEVLCSPGRPLAAPDRAFFEPRLGVDLSAVRIHDDSRAADSARSIGARAYTVGSHVAFAGPAHTSTESGCRLLAHELAHVVQQGAAPQTTRRAPALVQRDPGPAPNTPSLEARYNAALADARQTGNWQLTAELLNGFSPNDIDIRLASLSDDEVGYLHEGAVDNPKVGPDSAAAKKTAPGAPRASQAPQPAAPAQDRPPAAPAQPPQTAPQAETPQQDAGVPRTPNQDDQASRDRQVACVINEGGCASSRAGGVPSPEEMSNYNQKCRETSKFAGSDITPSDEECKSPPKPPPLSAAGGPEGGWTTGEVILVGTAVVIGAALIIVFAPELIPAAATFARGAVVALRIGTAVATALPAATAGGDAVVLAEVTATAVEAAPAVTEGGVAAARGAQALNLVVRSAQPIAQAVQASAPAAQIAVTSSAPTLAQAAAAIIAAGVSATTLKGDSQTSDKKDDKKNKDCSDKPLFWDPVVSTSSSQPGLLDACFLLGDYSMHGHHTWPEYAGGLETQPLMGVRGSVHISILQPQLDAFLLAGFAKDGLTRSTSQNGLFIARLRTDRALRRQMVAAINSFYVSFNAAYCNPPIPTVIYQSGIGATLTDLGGP